MVFIILFSSTHNVIDLNDQYVALEATYNDVKNLKILMGGEGHYENIRCFEELSDL
jgi:hypothetical protein